MYIFLSSKTTQFNIKFINYGDILVNMSKLLPMCLAKSTKFYLLY